MLARQTRYALRDVGKHAPGKVILAYEPVWSIGEGGIPADPDFANAINVWREYSAPWDMAEKGLAFIREKSQEHQL